MSSNAEDSTKDSKFYMDVPPDLKTQFQEACGLASMAAVTRQLWRYFVASDGAQRYSTITDAAKEDKVE